MSRFHKEVAMPVLICRWLAASHINIKHLHTHTLLNETHRPGERVLVEDVGPFCHPCDSASPHLFLMFTTPHSCTVARNHQSSAIHTRDRGERERESAGRVPHCGGGGCSPGHVWYPGSALSDVGGFVRSCHSLTRFRVKTDPRIAWESNQQCSLPF